MQKTDDQPAGPLLQDYNMLTKAEQGQRSQESDKLRAEIKRSTRDTEEQPINRATSLPQGGRPYFSNQAICFE